MAGIGPSGLVRHRLLDELATARGAAVAMVVAPAGFGKTTLLAHCAHAFDGPVSWLSVNPSDADAATLVTRLRDEFPVPLPATDDPGDLTGFVRAVRARIDTSVLLVIDDTHALEGSGAAAVLERLLVARPPNLP